MAPKNMNKMAEIPAPKNCFGKVFANAKLL
jgi:hypothetical protein